MDPSLKRICSEGLIGFKIHNSIRSYHHNNNNLGLSRTSGFAAGNNINN